jgi:hypothetical protein
MAGLINECVRTGQKRLTLLLNKDPIELTESRPLIAKG